MPKEEDSEKKQKPDELIDKVLLDARRIFLSEDVNNESAREVIRKLWYLDLKEPGKPILLVINSPGGAIDSGFAIWDAARTISSPVYTLITGLAASMGSVLSLCAIPGKRFATPNARIMIHQPRLLGVIEGQATDLEIQAKEMIKTRQRLIDIYVEATGKSEEEIDRAITRDTWLSAKEAKEYGLIDRIVDSLSSIFA